MFTPEQFHTLEIIHARAMQGLTYTADSVEWHKTDYWEADNALTPLTKPLRADCEEFARKCLLAAMGQGMAARLVVCTDETEQGHCITEVTDAAHTVAYYFDNRRRWVVTRDGLHGYTFLAVSPWNPQPGEPRPWLQVVSTPA